MNRIVLENTDLQKFIEAILEVDSGNPYGLAAKDNEILCSHSVLTTLLRRSQAGKTFVLPLRRQIDILWLVLSNDKRDLLKHTEEIKSFLIPSLAEPFLTGRNNFDPSKPVIGQLGAKLFPHGYYCLRSPLKLGDAIFEALARWAKLDEMRPDIPIEESSVNAYVLRRKFQQAVALQHWDEAEDTLTVIRQGHHLSDENCLFLKIQLLSNQGKWHSLWNSGEYSLVAGLDPLPAAVRSALLTAFYNCVVVNLEEEGEIPSIIEAFRRYSSKLGTLMRYRAGLSGDLFVRLFAYQATLENKASRLKQLCSDAMEQTTLDIINELLTLIDTPTSLPIEVDPIEQALKYFQEKLYDEAFLATLDCPASVKRNQLLLYIATMTEDLSICLAAKEAFENLTHDQQEEILSDPGSKAAVKNLLGINKHVPQQVEKVPTNWTDWFKEIHRGEKIILLFNMLDSFIDSNIMVDWKNSNQQEIERVLWEILLEDNLNIDQRNLLRSSLLDFAGSLVQDPNFPKMGAGDLYEQLVFAIQTFCIKNNNSAGFLARLLEGLFQIDVDHVKKQWNSMAEWLSFTPSVKLAGDVLELLELFHEYGLPGDNLRNTWDNWMASLCQQFSIENRLLVQGWTNLGRIAGGNPYLVDQMQEILVEPITLDPLLNLPELNIAIFSLREKAAQRAANTIMERNSKLKVKVCTDDRLSEQSKALASNSDIVIVVTACMSHALTYGIGPLLNKDPLYPRGSGETGIVQALEDYAVSVLH